MVLLFTCLLNAHAVEVETTLARWSNTDEDSACDARSWRSDGRCVEMPMMVRVEAGTVWMGSAGREEGRRWDEARRAVELPAPFAISAHEVTREQYLAIMGAQPSEACGQTGRRREAHPVSCVSWNDAIAFSNRLSDIAGLDRVYRVSEGAIEWDRSANGFRLPSEVEWEYSARAGTTTRYAGSDHLDLVAWSTSNARGQSRAVGELLPNDWGLYDLSGNVGEWVWDAYVARPRVDVKDQGYDRVIRGGSFEGPLESHRVAARRAEPSTLVSTTVGFRVVRSLPTSMDEVAGQSGQQSWHP